MNILLKIFLKMMLLCSCGSQISVDMFREKKPLNKNPADSISLEFNNGGSITNLENFEFDISDKITILAIETDPTNGNLNNIDVEWQVFGGVGTLDIAPDKKSAEFTAITSGGGEIQITYGSVIKRIKFSVAQSEEVLISAYYPNLGEGWLSHIRNSTTNHYNSPDLESCSVVDNELYHCIHAGQMRVARLNNFTSCLNVKAQDLLNIFEWHCIEKADHLLFVSKLKFGKGLSDLILNNVWKDNSLKIFQNNFEIAHSKSSKWWSDNILDAPINSTTITELNIPGIYTISSDTLSGGYRVTADKVALVGLGANNIVLTYNAGSNQCNSTGNSGSTDSCFIVVPSGRKDVWIENFQLNGISAIDLPIYTNELMGSHVRKLIITPALQHAIDLNGGAGSKFIWLDSIEVMGGTGNGINFDSNVSAVRVSNFKISGMLNGISLSGADNIIIGLGIISNNLNEGVISPSSSLGITFYGLNVNNNVGAINVSGSASNHDMSIIYSQFTNNDRGASGSIRFEGAGSIVFSHNIVSNSGQDGIYTNVASYSLVMSNSILMNNAGSGYEGTNGTIQRFHNMAAFNNGEFGIGSYWSTDVLLTGQMIFGGNGGNDCGNFLGATGVSSSCTQTGGDNTNTYTSGSHTAIYRKDRDVSLSFVGVADRDIINSTPGVDSDSYQLSSVFTDWVNFENTFRTISLSNSGSPTFLGSLENSQCDTGSSVNCTIHDYSLLGSSATGNPVLLNQSGNFTLSDNQFNNSFVSGSPCPSAIHGDQTLSNLYTSPSYFLAQAIEILDDGIGNDDGLCNSNEECIYAPNIGRYQGHGEVDKSQYCNFQDGVTANAVSGIKVYSYPVNGKPN